MKDREYICPKCQDDDEDVIARFDIDSIDATSNGTRDFYLFIPRAMRCPKCDYHWTEYFRLEYDGYYADGQIFNADGTIQCR